ncbi:hypothetical protein BsWGS_25075 [Bradybaena similaris]
MLYVCALVIQLVGLTLHIIGLGTPEWSFVPDGDVTYGLWEDCISTYGCVNIFKPKSSMLMATEAFVLLGMISGIVALTAALAFIVLHIMEKAPSPKLTLVSMATGIFALVCNFIAVVIWGAGIHDPDTLTIGYSFVFCITGGILMAIGGILAFAGGKFDED